MNDDGVMTVGSPFPEVKDAYSFYRGVDRMGKMQRNAPEREVLKRQLLDYRRERGLMPTEAVEYTNKRDLKVYEDLAALEVDNEARERVAAAKGWNFVRTYERLDPEWKDACLVDGLAVSLVGDGERGKLALAMELGAESEENAVLASVVRQKAVRDYEAKVQANEDARKAWDDLVGHTAAMQDARQVEGGLKGSGVYLETADRFAASQGEAARVLKKVFSREHGAFGMASGTRGLLDYGTSRYEPGSLVLEFLKLREKDEDAYMLALGALQKRLREEADGDTMVVDQLMRGGARAFHGSTEYVHGKVVNLVNTAASPFVDGDEGIVEQDLNKEGIAHFAQKRELVYNDIQQVLACGFDSSRTGFAKWLDDAGGFVGQSLAWGVSYGMLGGMSMADERKAQLVSQGRSLDQAEFAAFGEALGTAGVNLFGINRLGKLMGGKRYDQMASWLGKSMLKTPALKKIFNSPRLVIRYPVNSLLSTVNEFGEETLEPYAQYLLGNLLSGAQGMKFAEANDQALQVWQPVTASHMVTYSWLMAALGMGHNHIGEAGRQAALERETRARLLDVAESPEALNALGLSADQVSKVVNQTGPDGKLRLLEQFASHALERRTPVEGSLDDVAFIVEPENDFVASLMDEGRIDRYTPRADGSFDVRLRETGQVEVMDAPMAMARLKKEVHALELADELMMARGAALDATVDYYAKQSANITFESDSKTMTFARLQAMANRAMRIISDKAERTPDDPRGMVDDPEGIVDPALSRHLPLGKIALLAADARARVETALRNGELARLDGETTQQAATRHQVYFPALNTTLESGKRLIRFSQGEATTLDIVEEISELYVTGDLARAAQYNGAAQRLDWMAENLRITQEEFKAHGLKNWQLVATEGELTRGDIIEGMSKLMQAVFAREYRTMKLPEAVRRFMAIAEALCAKIADLIGLGAAFRKAVEQGKIDIDFEEFISRVTHEDFLNYEGRKAEEKASQEFSQKRPFVTPKRQVKSFKEARGVLKELRGTMMKQNPGSKEFIAIPGKGLVAPDTDYEVFITGDTISKSTQGKATAKSVNPRAHLAAAVNMDELWLKSRFRLDHADRDSDPNIKMIHRREADLVIDDKVYTVKLTAKEYNTVSIPNHIYSVEVESVQEKTPESNLGFSVSNDEHSTQMKSPAQASEQIREENSGEVNGKKADTPDDLENYEGRKAEEKASQEFSQKRPSDSIEVESVHEKTPESNLGLAVPNDEHSTQMNSPAQASEQIKEENSGEVNGKKVDTPDDLDNQIKAQKEARMADLVSGVGLDTDNPTRADQRDVFRVVKKAFRVNEKRTDIPSHLEDGTQPNQGQTNFAFSTLAGEMASWKQQLDSYLNGKITDRTRDIKVCTTPAVLRALGSRELDMVITPSVIDKVMKGKHAVPRNMVQQLPQAISDPIAIFDSRTVANTLVVFTELKEGPHHVIVAIHLNAPSSHQSHLLHVNRIVSLYGKDDELSLWKYSQRRYENTQKAQPWLVSLRLQLSGQATRKSSQKKILKPTDIVKWKEKNNTNFAIATLAGETASWKQQLDSYLNGINLNRRQDMRVCTTPAVLRMLGAKSFDLVISPGVVDKVMIGKHAVTRDCMEQLPQAISEPIAVFDSLTSSNSLVVLTELKEGDKNIVVAAHLDDQSGRVSVNRITSLYGKDTPKALLALPMRYLDIKKARPWLTANRLQLPAAVPSRNGAKGKLLTPADIVKWKGKNNTDFALDTKAAASSMRQHLEAARASAIRDYWALVISRVTEEENFLHSLQMSGKFDEDRIRLMQARGMIRAAIAELPPEVRKKVNGHDELLSYYLDALAHGQVKAQDKLTPEDAEKLNRKFRANPGLLNEFIGQEVGTVLEKVVKRCSEVINLHVRDTLFKEIKDMMRSISPEIDEATKKFKVGRIGADNVRYLRKLKEAVLSTRQDALERIETLQGKINALEKEMTARAARDNLSHEEKNQDLLSEKEELMREYLMWEQFGACGSRGVSAVLQAHQAMYDFLVSASDAWRTQLQAKVKAWDDKAAQLEISLPRENTEIARHEAMLEFKGQTLDGSPRKKTAKDIMAWFESPAQFLGRLAGKKKYGWYFKEKQGGVVKIQDVIDAKQMEVRAEVRKKLMEITKSSNEADLNKWFLHWNRESVFDQLLAPIKKTQTKIDIDKAQEILEARKKNPWFGFAIYTQESVDALQVEYNEWLIGKNKARKWLTIEKWEESPPQGLKVSRDQALYILMSLQQKSAENNLRIKGYNETVEKKLWDYVGEEGRQISEMLFDQYHQAGQRMKPGYEERYGVPWSENKRYSPLCWVKVEGVSDSELNALIGETNGIGTARTDGFLSVREKHSRNLDTTTGALHLFWNHVALTDNWAYSQKFLEETRGELRKPGTAEHLMVNTGGREYRDFLAVLNTLEHAGTRKVEANHAMATRLQAVQNTHALAVLVGQLTSYIKQTSAIFNALLGCDLSISDWVKGMARVASGKAVMNPKQLLDSDLFQNRKDGFAYSVLQGYKRELGGKFGIVEKVVEQNKNILGWLDAGTNSLSFAAAFDHYYRQALRQGIPHDEALQIATDHIETGLSEATQPVNWLQRANVLNDHGPTTRANFFLLSETVNKAALVLNQASRGDWKRAARSHLLIGLAMQTIGYLTDCILNQGDDDDDTWPDPLEYIPGLLFGAFNGVPILGELLSNPVNHLLEKMDINWRMQSGGAGKLIFDKKSWDLLQNMIMDDFTNNIPQNSRDALKLSKATANAATVTAMTQAFIKPKGSPALTLTLGLAGICNYLKYLFGFTDKIEQWQHESEAEEWRQNHTGQ